jgi:4'-phosphopantetheinyl transferase
MPLIFETAFCPQSKLWVWEVGEELHPELTSASKQRLQGMKKAESRACFLAIRHLLERAGYSDADIKYTEAGKPYLKDGVHVSISHSENRAALYLGKVPAGIDLQKILREKIQRAAYLFSEGGTAEELTLEWAIKEAVFKLSESLPLDFKKDIQIENGKVSSTFLGWERDFAVEYWLLDAFYLVRVT